MPIPTPTPLQRAINYWQQREIVVCASTFLGTPKVTRRPPPFSGCSPCSCNFGARKEDEFAHLLEEKRIRAAKASREKKHLRSENEPQIAFSRFFFTGQGPRRPPTKQDARSTKPPTHPPFSSMRISSR